MNLPSAMLFFIFRLVPKLGQPVLGEGVSAPLITRPPLHRNPISNRHTVTAVSSGGEQDKACCDPAVQQHDHHPRCSNHST